MSKIVRILNIILVLAVLPHMAHAGHGTIRETDTQIIVEYEGDADEVIAAKSTKEKEEKLKEQEQKIKEQEEKFKEQEVERIKKLSENHVKEIEKRRAKYKEGYED